MQFSVWGFFAGLAMFIYGMKLLEENIKVLGYKQLKKWLSRMINTRVKAMIGGTLLAGVLQSGTIVSTMVIAFAGAGLLGLTSGIGVIIGGNVGGTFLGVIITKLGFNYSIGTWALPLLSIGGISQFFGNKRIKTIGKIILGFGLLLFGIGFLKDTVEVFATQVDLSMYSSFPWIVFFIVGILLALLLHSSGTATIIAMSAMVAGIISFTQAIIIMLGASIGSSLISLYVSLGGSAIKRQIAYTHVGFNVLGALLFLPFAAYADEIMGFFMKNNTSPDAIARFQVLYNVVAAILVFPFIHTISGFMKRTVKNEVQTDYQLLSIKSTEQSYSNDLHDDILMLTKKIFKFNVHHLYIDQKILLDKTQPLSEKYAALYKLSEEKFHEDYDIIQTIEEALYSGLLQRLYKGDDHRDQFYLPYYQTIQNILYSAKVCDDLRGRIVMLQESESPLIKERLYMLKTAMIDLYLIYAQTIASQNYLAHKEKIFNQITHCKQLDQELIDILGKHLTKKSMQQGELSSLLTVSSSLVRSHNTFHTGLQILFTKETPAPLSVSQTSSGH